MLNIVIPMAGRGSRFADAGYVLPKPLIPVHGIPMIKVVMDNIAPKREHRFILICQNEHIKKYGLIQKLESYAKNVEVVGIDGVTEGQVCTVLCASKYFDNDEPLMTINSDQFINVEVDDYLDRMDSGFDGFIMTMASKDPKWSYVRTDDSGLVIETAEKKVISNNATVGVYNFKRGSDLVRSARAMIADNVRVNNEFYTCPAFNYLIRENKRIGHYSIGDEYSSMFGLGIPDDLKIFIDNPASKKLIK